MESRMESRMEELDMLQDRVPDKFIAGSGCRLRFLRPKFSQVGCHGTWTRIETSPPMANYSYIAWLSVRHR